MRKNSSNLFNTIIFGLFIVMTVPIIWACSSSEDDNKTQPNPNNTPSSCTNLPSTVINWLAGEHPQQTLFKCERESDGGYNIYTDGDKGCLEFYFDSQGKFLKQESCLRSGEDDSVLPYSDLPQAIQNWLKSEYPNARIKEAKRRDDGWKIKILDGSSCFECTFDNQGNLTKKESC